MTGNPYDGLAPYYVEHARTRAAYCDGVDRLMRSWWPPRVDAMLDVGSGDGSRAVRLAGGMAARRLVLSDPSEPMVQICRSHLAVDVWCCAAEDLPDGPAEFDVITCLWNVLGAVEGTQRRVEALRRMGARLSPEGRLFVDVHNRYNIQTAGVARVLARAGRDVLTPSETNGLVSFTWNVAGRQIPAQGYLFSEGEMRRLIRQAGLRLVWHGYVDYDTGRVRGRWSGQMALVVERPGRV